MGSKGKSSSCFFKRVQCLRYDFPKPGSSRAECSITHAVEFGSGDLKDVPRRMSFSFCFFDAGRRHATADHSRDVPLGV